MRSLDLNSFGFDFWMDSLAPLDLPLEITRPGGRGGNNIRNTEKGQYYPVDVFKVLRDDEFDIDSYFSRKLNVYKSIGYNECGVEFNLNKLCSNAVIHDDFYYIFDENGVYYFMDCPKSETGFPYPGCVAKIVYRKHHLVVTMVFPAYAAENWQSIVGGVDHLLSAWGGY